MRIGFSEYEAKVYLTLLVEYPATGYQISKNSGVPRSVVYEVLSRLKMRGAVMETIEGRVTLYRPFPPLSLLERHQEDVLRVVEGLRPNLEKIYQTKYDERTWSITGRDSLLVYAAQMIQMAEDEVFLVLNDQDLEVLQKDVLAAEQKGISVKALLTGEKELAIKQVTHHPPLESQMHGLTHTLLVIVDGAEVLISNSGDESSATITNNKNMVMIARQFVWMEFFTQRVYARLGDDLIQMLDEEDRHIFES